MQNRLSLHSPELIVTKHLVLIPNGVLASHSKSTGEKSEKRSLRLEEKGRTSKTNAIDRKIRIEKSIWCSPALFCLAL